MINFAFIFFFKCLEQCQLAQIQIGTAWRFLRQMALSLGRGKGWVWFPLNFQAGSKILFYVLQKTGILALISYGL